MRSKSSATSSFGNSAKLKPSIIINDKSNIIKIDYSGEWHRTNAMNIGAINSSSNTGNFNLQQKLEANIKVVHFITMNPPSLSTFRLREINGSVSYDNLYKIGEDYVDELLSNKRCRTRCYWESNTLVLHRINLDDSFELVFKRFLESSSENSPSISSNTNKRNATSAILRLVTTRRSLVTGEETESMALFEKH
eukprot:gene13309-17831_t